MATDYLLALKQEQIGDCILDPYCRTYAITGPRNKYDGIQIPIHVRHPKFKLPSDPSKPIIMVGPGTWFAPFRGVIQGRSSLAARGKKIGTMALFFGCRNRNQDFLYKKEWKVCFSLLRLPFTTPSVNLHYRLTFLASQTYKNQLDDLF